EFEPDCANSFIETSRIRCRVRFPLGVSGAVIGVVTDSFPVRWSAGSGGPTAWVQIIAWHKSNHMVIFVEISPLKAFDDEHRRQASVCRCSRCCHGRGL